MRKSDTNPGSSPIWSAPCWSIQELGTDTTTEGAEPFSLQISLGGKSPVRLPKSIADPSRLRKLRAYTWHYGGHAWIAGMAPSIAAWAERNLIEMRVWRQPPSGDASTADVLAGMLAEFLASDADWMIYLDADVMVHPLAPHPLDDLSEPGLWVMPEPEQLHSSEDRQAGVIKHLQRGTESNHNRCNDGVFLLDRATAENFLLYLRRPLMSAMTLEDHFNLCLRDAVSDGKIVWRPLPAVWNRLPPAGEPGRKHRAWFYHCSGEDKGKVLATWQLQGFLPMPRPSMTIKKWTEKAPLSDLIAIPFHLEGDPMKGESLRYALRSIQKHWQHPWPVIIYGTARPEWLDEGIFQLEPSYTQALLRAFSQADRVLWVNDDMFFLMDTSVEDHLIQIASGDLIPKIPELLASDNIWNRSRGHIVSRLHHEQGLDHLRDFSVHYPCLYEREKARQAFDHFGVWHKYPLELAYHGLHRSMSRPADEYATFETRDLPGKRWLNVQDPAEVGEIWSQWMTARFPNPSRWEIRV